MYPKQEKLSINTIKVLGMNAISRAKSGHGGIVLGATPIIYALFHDHLNVDVNDTEFFNRDRFIMSGGHGSALMYATMVVAGYHLTIADLKKFRQLHSKTPGHPETFTTPGVEACTGPLGQGCAMSIGFAICEQHLAARYNQYSKIIDHYTYVLHGDGDLEEGVTQEAIAIAGKEKLNKLIWLYDSNNVQLDGYVQDSSCWNVKKMFLSHQWNYILVKKPTVKNISNAIKKAKCSKQKPTIIEIKTTIGANSKAAGTNKAHSLTLDENGIIELKKTLEFDYDDFFVPQSVYDDFKDLHLRGKKASNEFTTAFAILAKKDKKLYLSLTNKIKNKFNFDLKIFNDIKRLNKASTREIIGEVLSKLWAINPSFMVVNPDISSSTKVKAINGGVFTPTNRLGQNINVGVREFIGADIVNGIVEHGGSRACSSTFLAFVDYNKAAIRVGAISRLPILNIYTHDTITVGEDGPTHQPIEQIPSLRLIPNHYLFRPANLDEVISAFNYFIDEPKSACTFLGSRTAFNQIYCQNTKNIKNGGYILINQDKYDLTIIATGSEVATADEVAKILKKQKIIARIVSMPCLEIFNEQSVKYRNEVLGTKPIISIEFAATAPWYKLVDLAIGIDHFGASGKFDDLIRDFQLDPESIAKKIINFLK